MARDLVQIIPDYNEKVGNLHVSEIAARDAESAGYAHYMAKMLEATHSQREENRKLAEIRFKRHGIDPHAQQPSTLAILARDPKDDEKHWLRHLPEGVQIRDKDGNVDVAPRPVTIEEVSHVEATRRRPKNTTGQSEKNGASEETRERAVHAYLCSPGIPLERLSIQEKERITQVTPYEELKPIPAPPTEIKESNFWFSGGATWWSNLMYKLRNKKK